jgi:hypothetical protein
MDRVAAVDPELDVTVIAGHATDPSVETPASEQPGTRRTLGQGGGDSADPVELVSGLLVHRLHPLSQPGQLTA